MPPVLIGACDPHLGGIVTRGLATAPTAAAAADRKRILLVDDHPIVREGLAQLINQSADLIVCGEAGETREALEALGRLAPDLAIVDISLRGGDGLELIKQASARWPSMPILGLSMHAEELYAERVLRAGARGYIMKQEATGNVLTAIRQVLGGNIYLSTAMRARLLQSLVRGGPQPGLGPLDGLSDRELSILRLIGRGYSTRQIAEHLELSVRTVGSHRDRLRRKLNLRGTAELVQYAVRWTGTGDP